MIPASGRTMTEQGSEANAAALVSVNSKKK